MESKTGEQDKSHVEISLHNPKLFYVLWKNALANSSAVAVWKLQIMESISVVPFTFHLSWDWSNISSKNHANLFSVVYCNKEQWI